MTATGRVHLGIDIGTSLVKAALIDDVGDVLAVTSCPVALRHPAPGHVEQDVDEIWARVADVVAGVRAQVPRGEIDMAAVTGQGDGCWLVDADGAAVRPGVSWMDGRAGDILDRWATEGRTDQVFTATGSALFPGAQAPILAWLDEHEPRSLDDAATAAYCKDVVFQRLTGERATDVSDASVPFGRHREPARAEDRSDYDDAVIGLLGLDGRRDLLAPVVRPLPVGGVRPAAAAALDLPPGLAVTDGPYDLAACVAGAGVTEPGDGLLIVGTTLACLVPARARGPETAGTTGAREQAGLLLALPGGEDRLRAMPAMVGTASLDWALGLFGLEHGALGDLLAASGPGARGVRALPHFAPSGERAPFVDPAARGQLTGLSVTTTAADVVRAICEGLGFAARQCLEAAGLTGRVVACGGGTRSMPWMRVIATALGRPVEVVNSPEVGARGAVASGLRHVPGLIGDPPDLRAWARPDVVVEPDAAELARYELGYATYLADQAEARERWHR